MASKPTSEPDDVQVLVGRVETALHIQSAADLDAVEALAELANRLRKVEVERDIVDGLICPYCWVSTVVLKRWFLIPSIRKCELCSRVWETGW